MRCSTALSLLTLCVFTSVITLTRCNAQIDERTRHIACDVFQQLIEINTTDSVGSLTAASEAMRQRFLDAGFPEEDIYLGGPNDRKKNLVIRLKGTGQKKPILFIGHLDVVEAR